VQTMTKFQTSKQYCLTRVYTPPDCINRFLPSQWVAEVGRPLFSPSSKTFNFVDVHVVIFRVGMAYFHREYLLSCAYNEKKVATFCRASTFVSNCNRAAGF